VQWDKAFIALLNTAKVTANHWRNILPDDEAELWQFLPRQRTEAQRLLRDYVGAWIDSGFQPDGSEMPGRRTYLTWNCQAIFESMEPLLNCFLAIPQKGIFALQASNNKQYPQRGALSMRFEPRGGIEVAPIVFRRHLKPEELAAFGFMLFWRSQRLYRLMRCSHCGAFSIPGRKVRKSYVRGWHCERCRNKASAMAATGEARKAFRKRWFALAVNAYRKYESHTRRTTNDPARFITEWVNESLSASHNIKRNTITRNLGAIRMEAERESHAKS